MEQVSVFKYGLILRTEETPVLWDELRRIDAHWNALVELEYARRRTYRATCIALLPDYAAAQKELDRLKPEIDALFVDIKAYRKENRTKVISAELTARKKALMDERNGYYAIIKEQTKKLPKETNKALEQDFWWQVKTAYQNSGCHWGNKDQTAQDFGAARQKALQDKGNLKLREHDGTGRLTQRIRKDGTDVTVAEFLSGKAMSVSVVGDIYKAGKPLLPIAFTYFVGRDGNGKRLPYVLNGDIIYHRDLPANGVIKKVQLAKETCSDKPTWTVCITVAQPVDRHPKTNIAGINLNFRKIGNGLRVATVVDDKGDYQHYHLPAELIRRFESAEKLHGLADDAWNDLEDYLKTLPDKERFAPLINKRRVALATCWQVLDGWQEGGADYEEAKKLLKKYQWYYQSYTGCRKNATEWRGKVYEKYGLEIAQKFAYLCINDTPLARLSRVTDKDGLTIDNELADLPRRQRVMAGIYSFKESIAKAAAKNGGLVETIKGKVTQTCHVCSKAQTQPVKALNWYCQHCGTEHDIDTNAAANNIKWMTGEANVKAKGAKWGRIKQAIDSQDPPTI